MIYRKVFLQNFETVAQLQAELQLLKVESIDVYIRPFANPVTKVMLCKVY